MNIPTAAYRPVPPPAYAVEPYLPWLINRAVRVARDNGYANIADDAIELVLAEYNVRRPQGGFVDSDGRNAQGSLNGGFDVNGRNAEGFDRRGFDAEGFNVDGVNANGQTREEIVETMVDGWDAEYAAAVATALAGRIA
jgi:hypothetical protein